MISDKHKDTTFSSPLNHYQYACRWNASLSSELSEKNRKALSAIPGIKKAFVNFLIETLFTLFKSFRLSGLISKLMDAPFRNADAIRFIAPKSKFFSDLDSISKCNTVVQR